MNSINELLSINTNYVLCRGTVDYADEFDYPFMFIIKKDELIDKLTQISKDFDGVTLYIGSNQDVHISSFLKYISNINLTEISDDDAECFEKHSINIGLDYLDIEF